MKKNVLAMALLLAVGLTAPTVATAQQDKNNEQTELVDSGKTNALEAYSDTTTTSTDSTVVSVHHRIGGITNSGHFVNEIFDNIGAEGFMGMAFVLMILAIIFIIAPLLIFGLLLFFIYKNRKQRMRLAEMAMQQGQPIPDQLLEEHKDTDNELWQKGLRQTFLGVGLLAFFGYVGSTTGIGIGILVTVIGLGKLAIVKTSKNKL